MSKEYPTIDSVASEMVNLSAIRSLPKGTEYFFSDLHGEYEAFLHMLKSASGMIMKKIDIVFGKTVSSAERENLANLIYYPEKEIKSLRSKGLITDEWKRLTIYRLILVCEAVSAKYTRYGGYERQFKGMSRAEAWCKSIQRRTLRMCDESTLNLLLMRHTGYQKVRENGVYITISGEKLWYNCGDDSWRWVDRKVYVRYDPAELEYVRIYDEDDTYIGSWQMDLSVFVDYITDSKDDIAARQKLIARQLRAIKQCGAELTGGLKIDALALAVAEAQRNIGKVKFAPPRMIEPIVVNEDAAEMQRAAGDGIVIDLEAMARNAARNRNITFDFDEE